MQKAPQTLKLTKLLTKTDNWKNQKANEPWSSGGTITMTDSDANTGPKPHCVLTL